MPATLVWTPKGRAKLAGVRQAVLRALERGLPREVGRMKRVAARLAPSPDVEARLLSRGTAEGGRLSGITLGTPEGGRFERGSMLSLQQAILRDPVVRRRSSPSQVVAGTGNPIEINARTGFFWSTRRRGIQGPTYPFNFAYVQAVEDGGIVWTVVPRPGTRALEPEPGVIVRRMAKTMPPFQMFRRAFLSQRAIARDHLRQDVLQAAREVGRA